MSVEAVCWQPVRRGDVLSICGHTLVLDACPFHGSPKEGPAPLEMAGPVITRTEVRDDSSQR
jgi:hypothetical protein